MNNKKTILVPIVILIGTLVTIAFIQKQFQFNNETSRLNFMEPGINIRGQFKPASGINCYNYNDNINFMPEYTESNDLNGLKNTGGSCFPFLERKNYYHELAEHKYLFRTSHLQTSYSTYTNNYQNITKSFSNNHNSLSPSIGFNEQPLVLLKLNSKREKNVSQTNSQGISNQQYDGLYGYNADSPFTLNKPFENNYNIQYIIVDPGDPPDGNPIPVQDGTYFLIFLATVYGILKIILDLKNN